MLSIIFIIIIISLFFIIKDIEISHILKIHLTLEKILKKIYKYLDEPNIFYDKSNIIITDLSILIKLIHLNILEILNIHQKMK